MLHVYACVHMCVHMCVHACTCVRACVCVCMHTGASDTVSWERNTKGVTSISVRYPVFERWDCEWLRAKVQESDTWIQILFHLFTVGP